LFGNFSLFKHINAALSSSWNKTVFPPGTFHPDFHSFPLACLTAVDDS